MSKDELKFTSTQASKLQSRDSKRRTYFRERDLVMRSATDTEVTKFIDRNSDPAFKPISHSRKGQFYWNNYCIRELRKGHPVLLDGRLLNPRVLDIDRIRKRNKAS